MQCAICNRDNPAGTKFCTHCGAVLRTVSPDETSFHPGPAPTSAAMRTAPVAGLGESTLVKAMAARPTGAGTAPPPIARDATPTVAKPSGQGVAIGLVVLLFAIAGWGGYQAITGAGDKTVTGTDLSKEAMALRELARQAQSSLPADPPSASGARAPGGLVVATEAARAEAEAAAKAAAEELAAKVELARQEEAAEKARADAAARASAEAAAKAAMKSTPPAPKPAPRPPKAPPKATPPPPATSVQAAPGVPEPAPKLAAAPVIAPAPVPRPDPLVQLREELARCEARDLFSRLGCVNRARTRHCDPYWGKVPECPATWMPASPERGQ